MRPDQGFDFEIEDEIERAAQAGLRYREWSQALKALWRERTMHRRRRELAFINILGLVWCIGCIVLDYIAGPQVLAAGLVLRLGLVAPLYLLAIAAAFYGGWRLQRWTTIAALPAFVGVAGYLGMHLVENEVQEYVMASGMLLAMSVVILPLRVPWLALMSGVSALALWVTWATMPGSGQTEFVLLCFITAIAFGNLALPLRTSRLKDRAFLSDLRAQLVSQRLVEANALLWEMSDRDELTGLPNRRHLERVLGPAFEASAKGDTGLAVVMIDIDHFKDFNDTHGHIAGDQTLVQVARMLARAFSGDGQSVARFGGEEFIAVLEGTDKQAALAIAERAREAISKCPVRGGGRRRATATVSMGVALRYAGDLSPTALIERADAALYEAKKAGRNAVRLAPGANNGPPPPVLKMSA